MTTASKTSAAGGPLDADRPDGVRLTVSEANEIGSRALGKLGFSDDDTQIIMGQLIDNALCGYRFTSLPRILAIAEFEKFEDNRKPMRVIHETPVSALIDGGNNVGYVTVYRGMEIAVAKARQSGIATVGIHNSYYSGRLAYFVERVTEAGFVAIHTSCGKPRTLPPGAARPAMGTNPICFGFPTTKYPYIMDMGTAAFMWGELMLHAHLGQPIPEGIGYDAKGHATTDAAAALLGGVVPFGGHKGFGLSLVMQSFGVLSGARLTRGQVQDFGFFFVVVDPKVLIPDGSFPEQMTELITKIKATPRQPGVDEIRIPSERSFRERDQRRVEGIIVDKKVVDSLNAL